VVVLGSAAHALELAIALLAIATLAVVFATFFAILVVLVIAGAVRSRLNRIEGEDGGHNVVRAGARAASHHSAAESARAFAGRGGVAAVLSSVESGLVVAFAVVASAIAFDAVFLLLLMSIAFLLLAAIAFLLAIAFFASVLVVVVRKRQRE